MAGLQMKSSKSGKQIDSTSEMMRAMCKFKLFESDAEELRVARLAAGGDPRARKEMISRNYRLVISLSRKYTKRGVDHMDLIQEGCVGLFRAVDMFEPERGIKFSTYAYWWIRQGMGRYVLENSRTVRVPCYVTERLHQINKFKESYQKEFGMYPSLDEIAAEMKLDVEKIQDILRDTKPMIASDATTTPDGDQEISSMFGVCDNTEDEMALEYVREQLRLRMSKLPSMEARIISLSTGVPLDGNYIKPLKAQEIGQLLGKGVPEVRRLRAAALRKLRMTFNRPGAEGLRAYL